MRVSVPWEMDWIGLSSCRESIAFSDSDHIYSYCCFPAKCFWGRYRRSPSSWANTLHTKITVNYCTNVANVNHQPSPMIRVNQWRCTRNPLLQLPSVVYTFTLDDDHDDRWLYVHYFTSRSFIVLRHLTRQTVRNSHGLHTTLKMYFMYFTILHSRVYTTAEYTL